MAVRGGEWRNQRSNANNPLGSFHPQAAYPASCDSRKAKPRQRLPNQRCQRPLAALILKWLGNGHGARFILGAPFMLRWIAANIES